MQLNLYHFRNLGGNYTSLRGQINITAVLNDKNISIKHNIDEIQKISVSINSQDIETTVETLNHKNH